MNLRRCLWCLLPRRKWRQAVVLSDGSGVFGTSFGGYVACGGSPAFRSAGGLLRLVEAEYSFYEGSTGYAREQHDLRRLAAGLRLLDDRAAVNGWLCEGCAAKGADFDPVGAVERGEVIL